MSPPRNKGRAEFQVQLIHYSEIGKCVDSYKIKVKLGRFYIGFKANYRRFSIKERSSLSTTSILYQYNNVSKRLDTQVLTQNDFRI